MSTAKIRNNFHNTKEDLENKIVRKKNVLSRSSSRKKILEEANNTKLRDVQIRVEDCLQSSTQSAAAALTVVCKKFEGESVSNTESSARVCPELTTTAPAEVNRIESENDEQLSNSVSENSVPEGNKDESVCEPVPESKILVEEKEKPGEESDCVLVSKRTVDKSEELECASRGDDDGPLSSSSPLSRMELAESANASLLRFPDDRSDSGVSSLRSGSGDERSGSRSSALSSSDEPQQHLTPNQSTRSPLFIPTNQTFSTPPSSTTEPVRVWRDPSLLLESEPHVRHIHSVQHQSLLMSHPSTPAASGPPPTSAAGHPASLYPPVPPPPTLMSPHPLQHHPHLAPPGLYTQHLPEMLWKQRYSLPVNAAHLLAPQGAHPAAEELLERERAYAQDRDRQERFMR